MASKFILCQLGGEGTSFDGGNFVMYVGGFPSFLLLNEYAANIMAKGKGRLGGWRGSGNGSGALSQDIGSSKYI